MSSFVIHSSVLTVKSVDLVVAHDGFLYVTQIICVFHSGYLDYRDILLDLYCCVTSGTWLTEREMDTSVLDDNWHVLHNPHGYFDTDVLFQ